MVEADEGGAGGGEVAGGLMAEARRRRAHETVEEMSSRWQIAPDARSFRDAHSVTLIP